MTYKEKLLEEYPERVDPKYRGGCCDCPKDYGYEEDKDCHYATEEKCRKCWNRQMQEFKVGDIVRIRNLKVGERYGNLHLTEGMRQYAGEIKEIERITSDGSYLLKGEDYYWSEEMLEEIREMTKSDLQTGYIITQEDGRELVVILNVETDYFQGDILVNADDKIWSDLGRYNDNLTYSNSNYKKFDIVKIEKTAHPYFIQKLDRNKDKRIVLWERVSPIEMTHAEIEAALGYPFKLIE